MEFLLFLYCSEEIQIQKLVATMTGIKMAINSAIPCFIILFFGSWSDRHNKRKPCILVPLCGQIMMAFSLLLCVYFENSPIEMAIFVEVFFPCITGRQQENRCSVNLDYNVQSIETFRKPLHNDGWFL